MEHYYEAEHQIEAFLAGCRAHVRDALRAYGDSGTPEAYEAWLDAAETLRQHELNFFGVDCPGCHGEGCDTCMGAGEVLPHEAASFYEAHGLSQADARDMVEAA